jgi:DNA-binding NarL/FixJ family response regulator
MTIELALIVSSEVLRAGLQALLQAHSGFNVALASADPGALDGLDEAVDVILVAENDLDWEVLEAFLATHPAEPALVILADPLPKNLDISRFDSVHGWGVLPLDAPFEMLEAAVIGVNAGLVVLEPEFLNAQDVSPSGLHLAGGQVGEPLDPLTERESEVLQYLAYGYPNKQIAAELFISEHTVKFHITSIYSKFGASNRTEAVRIGLQYGLVTL